MSARYAPAGRIGSYYAVDRETGRTLGKVTRMEGLNGYVYWIAEDESGEALRYADGSRRQFPARTAATEALR